MKILFGLVFAALCAVASVPPAVAHITPPVVFASDRDVVISMTTGSKKFFVREVRLTSDEQARIKSHWGWSAHEPFYRFFVGRNEQGQIVSAVTFLTEFTIHGPMRVAVSLGPDGSVKDAQIVEVTEEISTWARALMAERFGKSYVGMNSESHFGSHHSDQENMVGFYREVAARLIHHAAILFQVTFLSRGET